MHRKSINVHRKGSPLSGNSGLSTELDKLDKKIDTSKN